MLDGRVLEASQVEYEPFGKTPLKREAPSSRGAARCRPKRFAESGRSTGRPCGPRTWQVLLQRLDAPVHHGNGVAVLGPLRPVHGFSGQLPVQRGELVAQVCRDHEVSFVFRRVFWLKSMRSACSRSAPRRPTCPAHAAGAPAPAGPRRPSAPRRPWPASRQGRAASQVGTASAGPAR